MEKTQPIQRIAELAPLSRHHHDGLLFAWKINRGINLGISPQRMCEYCRWYWKNNLEEHFEEEEILFPQLLSPDHPMLVKMLDDHAEIRAKIESLKECTTTDSLHRLAQVISYHIRFEERQLFNYVQEVATPEQKEMINSIVKDVVCKSSPWKDEFWIQKPDY